MSNKLPLDEPDELYRRLELESHSKAQREAEERVTRVSSRRRSACGRETPYS